MTGKKSRLRAIKGRPRSYPSFEQRPTQNTSEQVISDIIRQFYFWVTSLRSTTTFEFDLDEENNHRCKMTVPIFPNLQSIGNGGNSKREAKANAIIAFLAHLNKRKEVGLFVPNVNPTLLSHVQLELCRATVSPPDMDLNRNEYLLTTKLISKLRIKKVESLIGTLERICHVRVITFSEATAKISVYIVGAKDQADAIRPFTKALLEPDHEQMFSYGEKLLDVFKDQMFLDNVCQRLKVLCLNHPEKCQLFVLGSSVNVQCCCNEFMTLRREFESELYRKEHLKCSQPPISSTNPSKIPIPSEHLESTRLDQDDKLPSEDKESDQLPDYSIYDDEVNASILRVLRHEDGAEEETPEQETTAKKSPTVIELSDDSLDSVDLQVLQTVLPKPVKKIDPISPPIQPPPLPPRPLMAIEVPQTMPLNYQRNLCHIVLDGQNIARNSNDNSRTFSWLRLSNAVNYFKNRGHENIIAFLPLYLREFLNKYVPKHIMATERKVRDELINSRLIAFTPSRYINGQRLTNYDDRFILQYAADNDGVVVSNDNFRDLQHEETFQFIINKRILPFATINDTFMPATDPLGRNGPHLDEFLSKIPSHENRRL